MPRFTEAKESKQFELIYAQKNQKSGKNKQYLTFGTYPKRPQGDSKELKGSLRNPKDPKGTLWNPKESKKRPKEPY